MGTTCRAHKYLNSSDIDSDQNEMAQRTKRDKDVPDLMKAKNVGFEIHPFGDVDHRSNGVEQSTCQQPQQSAGRHGGEYIFHGKDRHPAHQQINTRCHPARGLDHKQFDDDPGQTEEPDDAQKRPAPEPGKEIQAKGSVAAGDQQVNGGVVHFTQAQQGRIIRYG